MLPELGGDGFDYLWTLHPALAVTGSQRLIVPCEKGIILAPVGGRLLSEDCEFPWPLAPGPRGGTVDLSTVPAATGDDGYEMAYLTDLREGWYALVDRATHTGFGLAFDKHVFSTVWMFASYGGRRGLHVLALEPSTGYPYDLDQAAATGRCTRLNSGDVLETRTTAVILTGHDNVQHIGIDGRVT